VGAEDLQAFDQLAHKLFHGPYTSRGGEFVVFLMAHGLDRSGDHRCPMLQDDGHCAIHADRKPAACAAVPFDPLLPDRWQHLVLAERQREAFLGAGCLARGRRKGFLPVASGTHLTSHEFRLALERRRGALATDKRFWGDAVYPLLEQAADERAGGALQTPENEMLVLSVVPALLVVAETSDMCRQRCLEYVEAQTELIERTCSEPTDEPAANEGHSRLASFRKAYLALRRVLAVPRAHFGRRPIRATADEVEAWLAGESSDDRNVAFFGS
jgi:hypothetical protein